jgi:hypothetical protein
MPNNFDTQNADLGNSSLMVGAIESYSSETAERDTTNLFSTLGQQDLAETAARQEPESNFLGLNLILIIASVGILLMSLLRRVKKRRSGRSGRSYL